MKITQMRIQNTYMRHFICHANVKKFDNAVVNELFECIKINKYDYESIIMGRILLCFQYSLNIQNRKSAKFSTNYKLTF